MALIVIPPEFGKGGANVDEGTPRLVDILKNFRAEIAALQDAPAPVVPPSVRDVMVVSFAGLDLSAGGAPALISSFIYSHAEQAPVIHIGDKVQAVYFSSSINNVGNNDNPMNAEAGGSFETTISANGGIKQSDNVDLSGFVFLAVIVRYNS